MYSMMIALRQEATKAMLEIQALRVGQEVEIDPEKLPENCSNCPIMIYMLSTTNSNKMIFLINKLKFNL
jgi:hypothetical protein